MKITDALKNAGMTNIQNHLYWFRFNYNDKQFKLTYYNDYFAIYCETDNESIATRCSFQTAMKKIKKY